MARAQVDADFALFDGALGAHVAVKADEPRAHPAAKLVERVHAVPNGPAPGILPL